MNKFISMAAASVLAAGVSLTAAAPANAQFFPFFPHHHIHSNVGAGIAAGIIGFTLGAALASQNRYYYYDYPYPPYPYDYGYRYSYGYGYSGHVAACRATYRSYSVRTDTYLGFDGYRHQCLL
jgi:hypothetical protein